VIPNLPGSTQAQRDYDAAGVGAAPKHSSQCLLQRGFHAQRPEAEAVPLCPARLNHELRWPRGSHRQRPEAEQALLGMLASGDALPHSTPRRKKAVPCSTAKFREETSKKQTARPESRIAAMRNVTA
jgi:hypothetical protein